MVTRKKLLKITEHVYNVLKAQPLARNDNKVLLIEVYRSLGLDVSSPFSEVLLEAEVNVETILRMRRRVVALCPELLPCAPVMEAREKERQEFREFAVKTNRWDVIL